MCHYLGLNNIQLPILERKSHFSFEEKLILGDCGNSSSSTNRSMRFGNSLEERDQSSMGNIGCN